MVTCTLPPPNQDVIQHQISCINLNSNVKLSKSTLGFDSENRLFKSQRLQAALAFCHRNVESWYREVRIAPDLKQEHCPECRKNSSECEGNCTQDFENSQIITKESLEKFPKPKKWFKHFKILNKNEDGPQFNDLKDPLDGMEKGKSIERYKDMSKLIEEKFGRKSYNPVKKSASFMFSTKRIDLEETGHQAENNPALLKCQSLDTQLYSIAEAQKTGQDRGSLRSYDFQMCILDENPSQDNLNQIKPAEVKLKKTKPDLIPTLPKADPEHLYITEKLCNEFYVKTKVQKAKGSKTDVRLSGRYQKSALSVYEPQKTVIVQVHEAKKNDGFVNVDDIPYSQVADEVCQKPSGKTTDENIYAEICESSTCARCDNRKLCECKRTKTEYCYVKLGSNGDSVTQSDSDEAIYNTLR